MSRRLWAALLTPPGRSAVATIAVEGPGAAEIVEALFVSASGRKLSGLAVGAIAFGCWQDQRGEEIVICRTQRGVEIHCHGGAAASTAILNSLRPQVDIETTPTQWLEAEHQGELERAAVIALASSCTQTTAARLLAQLHGSLRRELQSIAEDIDFDRPAIARDRLDDLLDNARFGRHLTKPWQVVLSGPPNVGKSSLVNRILGYDRAIVFDQPGTTRDVVTSSSPLDGWPVTWSDTAGIRESSDHLEQQGVARARTAQNRADCLLHVVDVDHWRRAKSEKQTESATSALSTDSDRTIHVINKLDLAADLTLPEGFVGVSAATGQGVKELMDLVGKRLIGKAPAELQAALLFTSEQVEMAESARDALENEDATAALQSVLAMLK